jgi:hypothetical protein
MIWIFIFLIMLVAPKKGSGVEFQAVAAAA